MIRIRIKDPNPQEAKSQVPRLLNKMWQRLAIHLISQKFFEEQVEKIISKDIKLKIVKKVCSKNIKECLYKVANPYLTKKYKKKP